MREPVEFCLDLVKHPHNGWQWLAIAITPEDPKDKLAVLSTAFERKIGLPHCRYAVFGPQPRPGHNFSHHKVNVLDAPAHRPCDSLDSAPSHAIGRDHRLS